jgi:hypothetical protein
VEQSANLIPARPGGEFFAAPATAAQRRYEALRCYLLDGLPAAEAGARFGYTAGSVLSMARDLRAGTGTDFFAVTRPGPRTAPAKQAARGRILELRLAGHSVDEIAVALREEGTPLNRTGIAEVLAEEGLPRLWPRPHAARGLPRRENLTRTRLIDFDEWPAHCASRLAGLLLTLPDLLALDLPALVRRAGYPGTQVIPATNYLLSLLALKLTTTRRVSHVDDLAADPGAALFAGLRTLPKATALTTYSYRLHHGKQTAFLKALGQAMTSTGLAAGDEFNLDFHAVMHWGEDPALEKHYVPRRSQRTRSVLTFFAEDQATHTLVYANADLTKATQNNEVIAFCDHWRTTTGRDPALLVFDSKLTTQTQLSTLDGRGVKFLTLRARTPSLAKTIAALPADAWRTVTLDRPGKHTRPQVAETLDTRLSGYPATVRQLVIRGLGHDEPTILITNDYNKPVKALIERYARRMNIEQRLAEAIRSFHLDALSSAVTLNVDLDVVLCVLAGAVCAALRRRLPGYATTTPDTLQRRFLHTSGTIHTTTDRITVRLARRTYTPVLRHADLPQGTPIPWWGHRTLHYQFD